MKRLILASGSPRRKELLSHLNIPFEISVSQIEEKIEEHLAPYDIVMSLAGQKALDVLNRHNDGIILGADTLVTYNSRMLGKPNNVDEAVEMLQLLSGNTHEVFTGVAIVSQEQTLMFYERTEVTFYDLTEAEIRAYIDTKEPFDKAGAYGIQGIGSLLVKGIHGDYYSVVGLPIARVARELQKFGL